MGHVFHILEQGSKIIKESRGCMLYISKRLVIVKLRNMICQSDPIRRRD